MATWPPFVDDDGTGTTGTVLDQAFFNQLKGYIDTPAAGWTPYFPNWACTSSPVAIGDGQLQGRYLQHGKTVHVVLGMRTGATTNFGSAGGFYVWSLPLHPNDCGGMNTYAFIATIFDAAGGGKPACSTYYFTTNQFYCVAHTGGVVGPTVPYTWTPGCAIVVRGTFDVT